ncbi:MAG: ABC transporter permease [Polyangiaceae bacterium]|nr:ABC transporter permease [Polyangiaceae bacterium]
MPMPEGPRASRLLLSARLLSSPLAPLLAALLFAGIAFSLLSPYFLTPQNLLNIGRQIAVVSVVALGVTAVIIAGEIDLSMGSVMALSSVVIGVVLHEKGQGAALTDVALAVFAALCTGFCLGLFNGVLTVVAKLPSFIVTLGTLSIGSGLALSYRQGTPEPIASAAFLRTFGDGTIAGVLPVLVVYPAVLFGVLWFLLGFTWFGIQTYATGGNTEAARLAGVPVGRVKITALVLSGVLSGVAGVLGTARVRTAMPQLGAGIELDAIAAAVLGGTRLSGGYGTAPGTLLGVMLIGVVSNGLTLLGVRSPVQLVIKGMIIIAAVLFDRARAAGWLKRMPREPDLTARRR